MDNSPLGRLSPEVRNMIYEYVFDGVIEEYEYTYLNLDELGPEQQKRQHYYDPLLWRVCKQMKKESYIMYFSKFDLQYRGHFVFERLITKPMQAARELSIELANTFGTDALLATPNRMVELKPLSFRLDVGGWDDDTFPVQLYLRFDCPECNPWCPKVKGGKIDEDEAAGHKVNVSSDTEWKHGFLCYRTPFKGIRWGCI